MTLDLRKLECWLVAIGIYTEVFIEATILLLAVMIIISRGGKLTLNRNIVSGFTVLIVWSLLAIVSVSFSTDKFFQQFILLLYYFTLYYIFFRNNGDQIETIFIVYLRLTYLLCITALIQFVVYFITNVNIFYIFNITEHAVNAPVVPHILRVTSICAEPGSFSRVITPALGYYLFKGISDSKELKQFIVFIVTFFLTFSTMAYVILFLMVAYKYLIIKENKLVRLVSFVVVIVVSTVLFNVIAKYENVRIDEKGVLSDISMKIRDVMLGFQELDPSALELLNLSSYATMMNVWVATHADNRIIGTGLGTHEQNYRSKYRSNYKHYGLNMQEGYALGNRMYSEFGIIGIGLLILFLYKYHNKKNVINVCVFFLILTMIFRGGHYSRYGVVFFFFLYYYSSACFAKRNL